MPELPDITVYVEALAGRIVGEPIEEIRLSTPFLLRTVEPPVSALIGKRVVGVERLGKRIAIAVEDDLFMVIHLMIAGRLHWKARNAKGGRKGLAEVLFPNGCLTLTEAGTKRRASLFIVRGRVQRRLRRPAGESFEGRAHGDPREGRPHVDDAVADPDGAPGCGGHELLRVPHHVVDAGVRPVPLQHRELGVVPAPDLAAAETPDDLVDALPAVGQEALHLVLGRRDEPAGCAPVTAGDLEGIEMEVEPG